MNLAREIIPTESERERERERERVVCLESRGGYVVSLVSLILEEDLGCLKLNRTLLEKDCLRYEYYRLIDYF